MSNWGEYGWINKHIIPDSCLDLNTNLLVLPIFVIVTYLTMKHDDSKITNNR